MKKQIPDLGEADVADSTANDSSKRAANEIPPGFRLHRFELYNWGTFHQRVWRVDPNGFNSLLTGDIGSGKSTLVDALTTLLVPHHRIIYNKAAGAANRERNLATYILGKYKSEKDDFSQGSKPIALRDENCFSVLLGYFYNAALDEGLTLAQVFWIKDQARAVERFFVLARTPLEISSHFSKFGDNILDLKKKLRKMSRVEVVDNFKDYSSRFRRAFGIQHEQALDLFNQTVSMKSVGNLTDFIRAHMLERSDVEARIEELRQGFENLSQAHNAVLKARDQIEQLDPIIVAAARHLELTGEALRRRSLRDALDPYFAFYKTGLLKERIEQLEMDIQKFSLRSERLKEEIEGLRLEEDSVKKSIEESGGRRLQEIRREVEALSKEREIKTKIDQDYRAYAARLGLKPARNEEDFLLNGQAARKMLAETDERIAALQQDSVDIGVAVRNVENELRRLEEELRSLRSRKSNIPLRSLEIRRDMAEALQVGQDELPFVGELLQVKDTGREWEGAIERLLHGFGLSLLAPERFYAQVSRYVNLTFLKGRLVYYRVREDGRDAGDPKSEATTDPRALLHKLRIKEDSPFYEWLENELSRRFDFLCCDSMEDFHRLPRALTQNGQIKYDRRRHEKDDRSAIGDRSRYILGWENKQKIKALEASAGKLEKERREIEAKRKDLEKKRVELNGRRDACRDISRIDDFRQIDWKTLARKIQELIEEKRTIEESSDLLRTLQERVQRLEEKIKEKEEKRDELNGRIGRHGQQLEDCRKQLLSAEEEDALFKDERRSSLFADLDHLLGKILAGRTLKLQDLDKVRSTLREVIQKLIDSRDKQIVRLRDQIIQRMTEYRNKYPAETTEVDASLDALPEYEKMLTALKTEDLPRHEARFKKLLNEGTINSIALFQNQLDKEKQEIQEKIRVINSSLREIEYSPGTYVEITADSTLDQEIIGFQFELKQCLAHTLSESELYSEEKFLRVKSLIDRFSGREGLSDFDQSWTKKVTDVRNWFTFSASERWQEDGTEKEYYSDSSGKSGGQKEKLAYTVLASALAYQFGVGRGASRSRSSLRSFRFVAIDEAFAKGSDESTRYALELFKKLDLQLLIVTPLQKINIIEDYIRSVHFVHNQDGRESVIRNLTIEEYQEEKQKYQLDQIERIEQPGAQGGHDHRFGRA